MNIPTFKEAELEVTSITSPYFMYPEMKNFSYPVSPRDGYIAALKRQPYWEIIGPESKIFSPRILPDHIARGMVMDSEAFNPDTEAGGLDMFGRSWIYDPASMGSMMCPGSALFDDANQWPDKIVWPDIDSWDWQGSAALNNEALEQSDQLVIAMFTTGWYERLISFMDFEDAAVAMIDEDQQGAVKQLFSELSNLYIAIFDKMLEHFPRIDCFEIHDDWGSQQNSFFSDETAAEMIVPYMKRVTDFIHSKGRHCILHSCGNNLIQVPNYIAAGWDAWTPQLINDIKKIHELYGDQILIGAAPFEMVDENTNETDQRAAAQHYAREYCQPDKPAYFNLYAGASLQPAFREELYIQSRKNYSSKDSEV